MAVAIFARGRALDLRGRAERREIEGGAGAFTINEPRARIGQHGGPPAAGAAPWLPVRGVCAVAREWVPGRAAFPVGAWERGCGGS